MSKRKVDDRSLPFTIKMEPRFTFEFLQSLHDAMLKNLSLIFFLLQNQTTTATKDSIPSDAPC
jgi:hypothetical protein